MLLLFNSRDEDCWRIVRSPSRLVQMKVCLTLKISCSERVTNSLHKLTKRMMMMRRGMGWWGKADTGHPQWVWVSYCCWTKTSTLSHIISIVSIISIVRILFLTKVKFRMIRCLIENKWLFLSLSGSGIWLIRLLLTGLLQSEEGKVPDWPSKKQTQTCPGGERPFHSGNRKRSHMCTESLPAVSHKQSLCLNISVFCISDE